MRDDRQGSRTQRRSETVVSGQNTGHLGHTVSTKVNTRREFWLVAPDGAELLIEFFNSHVAVRDGQLVTAIWGAKVKREKGPFLMIRNDNAKNSTWLISGAKSLMQQMGLSNPRVKYSLIGFGTAALLCLMFQTWEWLLLLIPALIMGSARLSQKAEKIKLAVSEAMNLELQSFGQAQPPLSPNKSHGCWAMRARFSTHYKRRVQKTISREGKYV